MPFPFFVCSKLTETAVFHQFCFSCVCVCVYIYIYMLPFQMENECYFAFYSWKTESTEKYSPRPRIWRYCFTRLEMPGQDFYQMPLVRTCYSRYNKMLTLPFIFKEPLKFLSILYQTDSKSLSFWNLNSVYNRYIPIFSYWLASVWHIYLVLWKPCTRCSPAVMWDDLGGVFIAGHR